MYWLPRGAYINVVTIHVCSVNKMDKICASGSLISKAPMPKIHRRGGTFIFIEIAIVKLRVGRSVTAGLQVICPSESYNNNRIIHWFNAPRALGHVRHESLCVTYCSHVTLCAFVMYKIALNSASGLSDGIQARYTVHWCKDL